VGNQDRLIMQPYNSDSPRSLSSNDRERCSWRHVSPRKVTLQCGQGECLKLVARAFELASTGTIVIRRQEKVLTCGYITPHIDRG
jgi:hypothetical protein